MEAAQEIIRRRLMPRWWHGLVWSLLIACALALLVGSSDRTWLYFGLIIAAFCANSWEQSLRGVELRMSALPSAPLITCLVLFFVLLVDGIWLVIVLDDLPPSTAAVVGLVSGLALWSGQVLVELVVARSASTAGRRFARQGDDDGSDDALTDPLALRAAVVLRCVGSMSETTLAHDLGLGRAEAESLLERLAEQRLVHRCQHRSDPADRPWASLTPAGHRALAAHLTTLTATTRGAE